MSLPLPFEEDIRDCLQEVSNVAMGAAGESLAGFTGEFVELSIPMVRFVSPQLITEALASLQGYDRVSGLIQYFKSDELTGCALLALTETSFVELAQLAGREISSNQVAEELMRSLGLVVTNTCVNMLAEQLAVSVDFQHPELVALQVELEDFIVPELDNTGHLLSVEINLHLEGQPFNCDLLLLFPEAQIPKLLDKLNQLL